MSDNKELIDAIKQAEQKLADAINTVSGLIAKYEGNPHPYIRIPNSPRKEMEANMLHCSCDYCMRKRFSNHGNHF